MIWWKFQCMISFFFFIVSPMLLLSSHFSNHFLVFFSLLPPEFYLLRLQQAQPDDEPDKLSNRVFQFDPGKDRWTECSRMKYSRYRCGVAVVSGEIYVLGQTSEIGCNCVPRCFFYSRGNGARRCVVLFFRWNRV